MTATHLDNLKLCHECGLRKPIRAFRGKYYRTCNDCREQRTAGRDRKTAGQVRTTRNQERIELAIRGIITVSEAARLSEVAPSTIRRWAREDPELNASENGVLLIKRKALANKVRLSRMGGPRYSPTGGKISGVRISGCLSTGEAAKIANVTAGTIAIWCDKVPSLVLLREERSGNRWVDKSALLEFLDRRKTLKVENKSAYPKIISISEAQGLDAHSRSDVMEYLQANPELVAGKYRGRLLVWADKWSAHIANLSPAETAP